MRRASLGVDVWTWINAMLVLSCVVLAVFLRADSEVAGWIVVVAAAGAALTALGRFVREPVVPMTVATVLLVLPWLAAIAILIFLSLIFSAR